jgi:formylmethanofuran dehydrogenase subunit E
MIIFKTTHYEGDNMQNSIITQTLLEQTISFHGHWCPGLAIGVRASEWALSEMGRAVDEDVVAVVESDMCGVDAVQYLTGCTYGKGNLIHRDYGKNAFTFYRRSDGKSARLSARHFIYGDHGETLGRLHGKMLSTGLTEEEKKLWQKTRSEISKKIMDAELTDLFDIGTPKTPVPKMARILSPMICDDCNETVMESRMRHFGGQILCIPCFEFRENR